MDSLEQRLERYFEKARLKFESIKTIQDTADTRKILDSANRYYSDAQHFKDEGDPVSALAALEYAEGWIDAARTLGLITAEHTGELE